MSNGDYPITVTSNELAALNKLVLLCRAMAGLLGDDEQKVGTVIKICCDTLEAMLERELPR